MNNSNITKRKHVEESTTVHSKTEDDMLLVINDEESDDDDLGSTIDEKDVHDDFHELNLSDDDDNYETDDENIETDGEENETDDEENETDDDENETDDEENETEDEENETDDKKNETDDEENETIVEKKEPNDDDEEEAKTSVNIKDNKKVIMDQNYIITNRLPIYSTNKVKKIRTKKQKEVKVKDIPENVKDSGSKSADINVQNNEIKSKVIKRNRVNNPKQKYVAIKDRLSENTSSKSSIPEENEAAGEYREDSSDEEDLRNTIGNVPINWYDEYPHLGYGLDSLPIMKPSFGDKLDQFLDRMENPDYYRTVLDKQTGQRVKLSDEHLDFINRVMTHKVPNANCDLYEPFPDLYSHEVMEMPLSGRPEHKRSFIPSKAERQEVVRLATLIKKGLLRRRKHDPTNQKVEVPKYYDIWKPLPEDERIRHVHDHISAPKMPLPGHKDSYNPPPEYLVKRADEMLLKGKKADGKELFDGFWRKFKSIREIPGYPKFVKERFERLMDLYITPRKRYKKIVAKSSDFLPDLPDKKDLRPYPTMEEIIFKGHRSIIRSISIHPAGKYVASGSDDHTVRIWEISTGRCLRTFEVEEVPKCVSWNPNPKLFLVAVAMGRMVMFLNPENHLTDKVVVQQTNSIFKEEVDQGDYIVPERIKDAINWRKPTEQEYANGYRLVLDHFKEVTKVVWHKQGDYFATVIPEGDHRSVLMHQLSRWRSQVPFSKNKGRVQTVAFHPKLPQLFVVTQSHIRVYDLQRQGLLKKVQGNSRWISCIDVHPGGEHFVIGGYDRRVNWFEMEYTKRPHLMRYHSEAVRSIKFHRKYPLYASCSDDGKLVVTYGMVYDDWLKDPLVVPLKQLKGHKKFDDLYVLDVAWHPYEPYLLSAGADATIRLWH